MEENELKAIKIRNPEYIGVLGPFINSFLERVDIPDVTYESMYSALVTTAQHGAHMTAMNMRDGAEFWVVLDSDDKPVAFAHWHVKPLPSIGTVSCDYIFSWNRKKDPVRLLLKELTKFAFDHNCPKIMATLTNEAVFQVFEKVGRYMGYKTDRLPTINIVVTKNGQQS